MFWMSSKVSPSSLFLAFYSVDSMFFIEGTRVTLLSDFSLGFCDFAMLLGLLIDLLFCDNLRLASSAS